MRLHISPGNSKIGKCHNISFPPVTSCRPDAPCVKDCYAKQAYLQYPNTRKAWDTNYGMWGSSPVGFSKLLHTHLQTYKPTYFRYFVSGDIPDQLFLDLVVAMAGKRHRNTKFLLFTKRGELDFSNVPSNVSCVLSMWPGWEHPFLSPSAERLPKAWMVPKEGESRLPGGAIECAGGCASCPQRICWDLADIGADVYFHKH